MSDRIEAEILDVLGEEVAAAVETPLVVIKGSKGDPGKDGITPTIGQNGNWYLGEEDTGKPSRGAIGAPGKNGTDGHSPVVTATKSGKTTTISVDGAAIATVEDGADGAPGKDGADGSNGKDGKDGAPGAKGADGITPTIGANGHWYLGPTDTGKPSRGEKGEKGDPGKDGAGMDITGATVGQIAKITAVDASGVPTAWSPADMPSGGSHDAVLYTAQELTYGQKFQARKNIEAAASVVPTITGGVSLCPANVTDSNTAVHTTTTTAGGDDFTLTLDGGPENAPVRVKGIRTPTDADTNAAANVEYVKAKVAGAGDAITYVDFWPTGSGEQYNGNFNGYQIELATDQTFDAIFDSFKAGNKIVARLYESESKDGSPTSSVDASVTGTKGFGAIHFQFVTANADTGAIAGFPFIGEAIMMIKWEEAAVNYLIENRNVLPTPNADGTDNGKVPIINGTKWELKTLPTYANGNEVSY